jgi:hypothetical protein
MLVTTNIGLEIVTQEKRAKRRAKIKVGQPTQIWHVGE